MFPGETPNISNDIGVVVPIQTDRYSIPKAKSDGIRASSPFLYMRYPINIATIISILMGITDVGTALKSPAIAIAKTANTSQVRSMTKMRNISLTRELITVEVISAMERPFSFRLITNSN